MGGPRRDLGREEELRLLQEFLRGSDEAFETLVKEHQKNVYSLALRMTRNPSAAQDLSQEVFVQLYLHAKDFRGESSLKTWLYRTTVNACLNYLKTAGRYQPEEQWQMADPTPGALQGLEEQERQQLVEEAIHYLPPQQKAALILRVQEEMPYEEVAKALGCSVSAAKSHFHFAVQNVKKRVGY